MRSVQPVPLRCVCEAEDGVAVVVVAAAGVPCDVLLRFGCELHHALWHCRAWECASAQCAGVVGLCPDEGIDVLRIIGCFAAQNGTENQKK